MKNKDGRVKNYSEFVFSFSNRDLEIVTKK